ncbi:oxidoreductase C-terminal domain-containing protein [Saccharopolyspora soli]|uniref:oxidoreductase C-terminal domain-containing protein n=1 Tax=Saccharopolyspora soli TaxID=2926618 RepID=UPI0027DFDE00|nr:oxidoreductase C-terminal domain-containing protein [Saccharopolyspora soli]
MAVEELGDLLVAGAQPVDEQGWQAGPDGQFVGDLVAFAAQLWTGVAGVYAAGDAARWHNQLFGRPMRLEHWTSAAEQGAAAVGNALDPASATPYETVPYFWSDWYDSRLQFVGVPDAEEVVLVDGGPESGRRCVALYRDGDRLVGAFAVNGRSVIMKYRGLIGARTSWVDALDFAETGRGNRTAYRGRFGYRNDGYSSSPDGGRGTGMELLQLRAQHGFRPVSRWSGRAPLHERVAWQQVAGSARGDHPRRGLRPVDHLPGRARGRARRVTWNRPTPC